MLCSCFVTAEYCCWMNGFLLVYFRATHNTAGSDLLPSHTYRCQHVAWSTGTQVSATFISLCACDAKNVHTCISLWLVVGMIVETSMKLVDAVLLTCLQIMVMQVLSYMCVSGQCRGKTPLVAFWVLSVCFISEHWSESALVNCFYECLLCVIPEYLRPKSQSMSDVAFVSGEQYYSLLSLLDNTVTHTNCVHQQSQAPASVYSTQRLGLWLLMHGNWCVCVCVCVYFRPFAHPLLSQAMHKSP